MKNIQALLATGLVASAVFVAGCGGQQSQAPQTDDQPETVIVYRDSEDPGNDGNNGNNDDSSGSSGSSTTVSSDTSSGTSSGSVSGDADDNMQATDQVPEGFPVPIPGDYQVERVGETERELAVDLLTPSGQDAYNYYEQALRDEGFDIEEAEIDTDEGQFDANIDFRNQEYDGDIDFNGDYLEIDVEILNPVASSGSSNNSGGSGSSSGGLPSGFPVSIPDDYEVQSVQEGVGDDAGGIDVTLDVPDGQAAFDYYSQNLEGDGFIIEEADIDNDSINFDGDIDFSGADYEGNVDVTGNTVEIDLDSNQFGD